MTALRYITQRPPNASTPLSALDGSVLDVELIYQRNNFEVPADPPHQIDVSIAGESRLLDVSHIQSLESTDLVMVLECAGNGRIYMDPVPDGTPWDLGGVSPVNFSGPPLLDCLGSIDESETELIFTGADNGEVEPEGLINYQFSLERALWDRSILATHLGGETLTTAHGGPIRLVVPGHYGMKSVKWVKSIESSSKPFDGHFVNKYRYIGDTLEPDGTPVGEIRVRSLISSPFGGETRAPGVTEILGSAWSGGGGVENVEVAIDDGPWQAATVEKLLGPHGASRWSFETVFSPGRHVIRSRATDRRGNVQPAEPQWNQNGYGNNLIHRVEVSIKPST